jgi:LacI family transcriptional regulator
MQRSRSESEPQAEELNYSASPLARSLVLGKTNTIAVVVPDLANPTFHGVLRGLSRAASHDGYHILIADSARRIAEERILAVETRRRCDGLVLCAPRMAEADLEQLLEELKPVVLVNREAGSTSTPVIAADYRTGLVELLNLLYDYGHRSLVYLAGAPQSASNARRLEGVRAFLDDHPDTGNPGTSVWESTSQTATTLLSESSPPQQPVYWPSMILSRWA